MPVRGKSSSWFCVPTNVQSAKSISILERSSTVCTRITFLSSFFGSMRREETRGPTLEWVQQGGS